MSRQTRLRRWHLLLGAIFALGLLSPWPDLQLDSTFGQAAAAGHSCRPDSPYWLAAVAPPPLQGRDGAVASLTAVTYNLHSGLGPNWRPFASRQAVEANLRRIARSIAGAADAGAAAPDVVALNEVDFASRRSGGFDQAAFMAAELHRLTGYAYAVVRGETWQRSVPGVEVRFGNALLSRHPVLAARACPLGGPCNGVSAPERSIPAGWLARVAGEPRGVVTAQVSVDGRSIDVLVTHLEAFVLEQREAQASELIRRFVRPGHASLLLGDVNSVPTALTGGRRHFAADRSHDILTSGPLLDARLVLAVRGRHADFAPWRTYPAAAPQWPLDGAFASAELMPVSVRVIGGMASDHRGLAVQYRWLDVEQAQAQQAWHRRLQRQQLARIRACDFGTEAAPDRWQRLITSTGFAPDLL